MVNNKLFIVAPLETENFSKFVSSRNLEMAKFLFDDYDVEFLMTNFSHREKKFTSKKLTADFLSYFSPRISFTFLKSIPYYKNISILRLLYNFIFSFQVFIFLLFKQKSTVLINSIPPDLLFFVSLTSKIRGHDIILDVRDIWPDSLSRIGGVKFWLFKFYCDLYKKITPNNCIIKTFYVSKRYLDWLELRDFGTAPIYLPLGFDANRWKSFSCDHIEDSSQDNHVLNILYIGYLNNQSDIPFFLDTIKVPFKLHIIGPDRLNFISDNIVYHGSIEHSKLPKYLSKYTFHFGLIPLSKYSTTAFPNKFFDYIAMSLPILYSNSIDLDNIAINDSFVIPILSLEDNDDVLTLISTSSSLKKDISFFKYKFSMQELYSNEKK